jgi:hypothetical protein
MTNLLPCPNCEDERPTSIALLSMPPQFIVRCPKCGYQSGAYDSAADARKEWNIYRITPEIIDRVFNE